MSVCSRFFLLILCLSGHWWHPLAAQNLNEDLRQALAYYKAGSYEEALPIFEQHAEVFLNQYEDDLEAVNGYLKLLYECYVQTGREQQAHQMKDLIASIAYNANRAQSTEDPWQTANHQARALYQEGRYEEALRGFEYARQLAKEQHGSQHQVYATLSSNIALAHKALGHYQEAISFYEQACEGLANTIGTENGVYATACSNLGVVYALVGRYLEAETCYQKALDIERLTEGVESAAYATSLNNLASLYKSMGLYEKAEPQYKEALRIRAEVLGTKHADYATSCNNLGLFYKNIGQYLVAEKLLQEALRIWSHSPGKAHPTYATGASNLALLYEDLGKYAQAQDLHLEVLQIRAQTLGKQHQDYALAANNLAAFYAQTGDYAQAHKYYQEALDIKAHTLGKQHPSYATTLSNQADILSRQGKHTEALVLLQQAYRIRQEALGTAHPDFALAANNLAACYFYLQQYDKAQPLFEEAVRNRLEQLDILLPTLAETERRNYVQTLKPFFDNYYLYAQTYTQAAPHTKPQIAQQLFDLNLRIKGLLFLSFQKLQRQILESQNDALISQYHHWKSRQAYLVEAIQWPLAERQARKVNLQSLRDEVYQLEKQLLQGLQRDGLSESNTLAQRQTSPRWQDIQQKLQPGEVLIDIVRSQGKDETEIYYTALLLQPQQAPQWIPLHNGYQLESRYLPFYRKSIALQKTDTLSYRYFWEPLRQAIGDAKRLYLCPDGAYHQVNLLSLLLPDKGKYLHELLDIRLLVSPQELLYRHAETQPQQRDLKNQSIYLFGYPLYEVGPSSDKLSPDSAALKEGAGFREILGQDSTQRLLNTEGRIAMLPGTQTEVMHIAQMAEQAGMKVSLFVLEQARETALKQLEQAYMLHVATHGFFLPAPQRQSRYYRLFNDPLKRSGLLLAGASQGLQGIQQGQNDGILYAHEVLGLRLENTALVVLSACETGLGELSNGEGVYGLQRAFRQAGAQRVLMSLWTVSDEATQALMSLFYQYALLEKLPTHEAFRKAQEQLRSRYPHPYYWGAFVLVGGD